eukprot:UN31994
MLPMLETPGCWDPNASFFGFMGITSAIVFANLGAAYGTAKSGVGIASMGVMHPELVMRNMIPVVMAGVLGIYGLIVAVILNGKMDAKDYGLLWLRTLGSWVILWIEWIRSWYGYRYRR